MKLVVTIGCAALLGITCAQGANFRVTRIPGTQNLMIAGTLVESDLRPVPSRRNSVEIDYQIGPDGGWTAEFMTKNWITPCPREKTAALNFINGLLGGGVVLDTLRRDYSPRLQYGMIVYCTWGNDNQTDGGGWAYDISGTRFPPGENQPLCNTSVPTTVDLGSLTVGETAHATLQGYTRCDKDTSVKVSLLNVTDPTAPPGELAVDDARVRYDIDGGGTSKTYPVHATGNGSPFNLNFRVTDTGRTAGDKTASLVLSIEVP